MIQVTVSGEKKPVQAFEVRIGGVETPVKIAQVRVGGVAKTFWQAFSALVSPSHVSGTISVNSVATVTTSSATASVTGGSPPLSYAWTGGSGGWSIRSPASATTAFQCTGVAPDTTVNETFNCAVSDASGAIVSAGSVTASATNIGTL